MDDIFTIFIIQVIAWIFVFLFTLQVRKKNARLRREIEILVKTNFEKKTGAR